MGSLGSCCTLDSSRLEKAEVNGPNKGGHTAATGGDPPTVQAIKFSHAFTQDNPGKIDEFYQMRMDFKLGSGPFGDTYKATHKPTQADRAVKCISYKALDDAGRRTQFQNQLDIIRQLDHPNIAKFFEIFQDAKCTYIAMEACSGGELLDRVMEESRDMKFTERKAATYFKQIASAIAYLHKNCIAHRDVKPDNFLLQDSSPSAEVKVIDFVNAVRYTTGGSLATKTGAPYYMAPEVRKGSYDYKCDVWSCGVLTYIMLCGSPPFTGDTDEQVQANVSAGPVQFPSPIWDEVSEDAKDLINSMLAMTPGNRPEADVLLTHNWLKRAEITTKQPLPSIVKKLQAFNSSRRLKKVCLTMIATQLQEKDVEDLRRNFKSIDKNGDGVISREELVKGLETQAKCAKVSSESLEQIMTMIDSDGSGEIDYTEFIAAVLDKQMYQRRDVVWEAFRTFDIDGNGKVEKHELQKVLAANNKRVSTVLPDGRLDEMLAEADKNGDGFIDFEEFMEFMKE